MIVDCDSVKIQSVLRLNTTKYLYTIKM